MHDLICEYETFLRAAGRAGGTIDLRLGHIRALAHLTAPATAQRRDLLAWLARPIAAETRKSYRSSLVSWFGWLVAAGYRTDDPAADLPRVRTPRAVARPAPNAAVSGALLAADTRDALMVRFAAYAGLRCHEVAQVHRDDVADGRLRVCGKGGHVRVIPVYPQLSTALDAEWQRRDAGELHARFGDASSRWLFPGQQPGTHLTPLCVGKRIARLLGNGLTAHQLRHWFATTTFERTRDIYTVAQLLGHASIDTTRRYIQLPDDALRVAVESLPDLLAGLPVAA